MRKRSLIIVAVAIVASLGMTSVSVAVSEEKTVIETETQQAVKKQIEERRVNLKSVIKEKTDRMAEQLKSIQNERKRSAVMKIDASMIALNTRMVDHYLAVIGQIENVLMRVIEKLDQADRAGTPIGSARSFVNPAREAIVATRSAITAQSGVVYNVEAGDESVLKTEIKKTRDAFKTDLDKVKESVKAARSAVLQIVIEFNRAQPK